MGQLEDMGTFVRIIESGSISQAASQMGIVKSAISRRLVDLEVRLGVQLLTRTTRKSSLTEAGQKYYDSAVRILADVAEVNASTSHTSADLTGTLKISAPLSFGLQHLSQAISEFAQLHSGLVIHMDFNDRQIDLIDEGYDVAIRIASLKDSSLMARKLAPIRHVLCASPDYISRMGSPDKPIALKKHHILHYANAQNNTWQFLDHDGRKHSVNLLARMLSNNGDFLKQIVKDGHGIIYTPTFIVWKEILSGELVTVMDDYPCLSLNAYAVYPQTHHLPARLRIFIDFLINKFGGEPYWDQDIINV